MARNRSQRRKLSVYELRPLFRRIPSKSPLTEAELEAAPPHYLEGEVGNVIFASVPPTTSAHSVERLRDTLRIAFKDEKAVVVLTHNIELLEARRLPSSEAAAIIRQIEAPEQETEA